MGVPSFYVNSVEGIHPARLQELGKKLLIIDLDNTVLPWGEEEIGDDMVEWVSCMKGHGIQIIMVSNSWLERVRIAAAKLGIDYVDKAVKPFPFAFLIACKKEGVSPRHAVVVGDQVFTDVMGGTLCGMMTVLVTPRGEIDMAHTKILRNFENLVLRDRSPQEGI